jgi:hypothetical protein
MKSSAMSELNRSSFRDPRSWATSSFTLAFLVGCGAAGPGELDELTDTSEAALQAAASGPEDGLAEAFQTFVDQFTSNNLESQFVLGCGFHPGMSTEKLVGGPQGLTATARVMLDMNTGRVQAFLNSLPSGGTYDLWFVKNVAGGNRTALPENGDQTFKVGRFQGSGEFRQLDVSIGLNVNFDLDLVVVTRGNKTPAQSRVLVGERTILEKRLFRFRQNQGLDPITGAVANNIETADPLVARGAQLFFNETFGGNGRTCGTCHRAENNLTIDPAFIATLPPNDPLFVAETNPLLAGLENPVLLRERGLILENVDGFEDPTRKFVMRSVPHTLSLPLTNGILSSFGGVPDHRLGWGGDGGPGRSTLQQFAFGAVMQHFTKTLSRRPGIDFRIPTQEELDALEAFQLFTGRQKGVDFVFSQFPTNARAANGSQLFQNVGCTFCHDDLFDFTGGFNSNFDTGVANLTPDLVFDDGFFTPGDQTFNPPPLAEAADTPPFFHNNAVATIEDAVGFYFSPTFQASPSSFTIFPPDLATEEQRDIAAFLRVVNASTNLGQVRKRVAYVETHRSPGNTDLLTIALADARDARVVLADQSLNPEVRTQIASAETILRNARGQADNRRPSAMRRALALLDQAASGLFTTEPPTGGTGGTGGSAGSAGSPSGGTSTMGGTSAGGAFPTGGVAGSVIAGGTGGSDGGTASGGNPAGGTTGKGGSVSGGTSTAGTSGTGLGGAGGRGGI